MKIGFQKQNALIPALSHRMGQGKSHAASLDAMSPGFAGWSFAMMRTSVCCPPLRVGGVSGADGERAGVRCSSHHL